MRRALAPVLRDIETTGASMPTIADSDWVGSGYSSAWLWSPNDGTGRGIHVDPSRLSGSVSHGSLSRSRSGWSRNCGPRHR